MVSSSRLPFRRVLVALAAVLTMLVSACSSSSGSPSRLVTKTAGGSSSAGSSSSSSAVPASPTAKPGKPVHIKLLNQDGVTYGVGMPVIAFFNHRIKSAKALQAATTVTINGTPAKGAWYFETSQYLKGYPIEGHFRLRNYWPAHATIHIVIPAKGVTAGGGYAFDDSLTSDFSIGARNISVVNDATHMMTVSSDGKKYGTFPVSLGATNTPTAHGIKVIMEKGRDIRMTGPGYDDPHVKFTQRLTYAGEYLHSAPWNVPSVGGNIGRGDSSNGCTNLLPSDAERLYHFLRVGDVVNYPDANGPAMSLGAGYGDWNVDWPSWQTGGLVSTIA